MCWMEPSTALRRTLASVDPAVSGAVMLWRLIMRVLLSERVAHMRTTRCLSGCLDTSRHLPSVGPG